jgi:hypothetical protein
MNTRVVLQRKETDKMYRNEKEYRKKKKKLKHPYILGILVLMFLSMPKGSSAVKHCLYICWDTNQRKVNKKLVFNSNVPVSVVSYIQIHILSVTLSSCRERVVFPNMKGVKESMGCVRLCRLPCALEMNRPVQRLPQPGVHHCTTCPCVTHPISITTAFVACSVPVTAFCSNIFVAELALLVLVANYS